MEREGAVGVLHGEVALHVSPLAVRAALPVGLYEALGVALPDCRLQIGRLQIVALERRLEACYVAPEGAGEVGVRGGDHDLALLVKLGRAILHLGHRAARLPSLPVSWSPGLLVSRSPGFRLHPDIAEHPGQRVGVGIGAQGVVVVAVEVGPDDAAVLGGPVGVDVLGRHHIHAELLHGGADWLGAERADAQARHSVLLHIGQILRVGHDAFEEGDAGLEDLHAVALDDAGEAAGAGEDRRALDQDAGAAAGERGAEHVALAGDPARVGHHENHIARLGVEAHLHGVGEAGGVAAVNMDHALGLAGAARGVDDKQRELGV